MKFLKWLGAFIFAILILFLLIPLFLSSDYHIERSINIDKHIDLVFQSALDMDLRPKWDPWIEMDPEAIIEVNIKPEIIGSGYTWKGELIGEGEIIIQEFIPNELIKSKLHFIAPRAMESDVIWTFIDNKTTTNITWAFEGKFNYLNRWAGLSMDKMLGEPFEKGLNNFKKLVEKIKVTEGRTGDISIIDFKGIKAITIKEKCSMNKLSSKMMEIYPTLMIYLQSKNIEFQGYPFAIYHELNEDGFTMLECGLPVPNKIEGNDQIKYVEIDAGKALMASHYGHFNTVGKTYEVMQKYISENNLEIKGSPFEIYATDPLKEPDQSKWETQVHFLIK